MKVLGIILFALLYLGGMISLKQHMNIDIDKADIVELLMVLLWPLINIFAAVAWLYDSVMRIYVKFTTSKSVKKK